MGSSSSTIRRRAFMAARAKDQFLRTVANVQFPRTKSQRNPNYQISISPVQGFHESAASGMGESGFGAWTLGFLRSSGLGHWELLPGWSLGFGRWELLPGQFNGDTTAFTHIALDPHV